MKTVIWLAGRFVTEDAAHLPLLARGYLLGDGVFATMRGYDGACFRPETHLAELVRGAAMLDIDLPMPPEQLAELADEAARRTDAANAYVRVTLAHGADGEPPTLSVIAHAMDVPSDEDYARGIDAVIVTPRRIPPACLDGTIKTTSYVVQSMARREARARGAREGIQLAVDGSLAGGAMANLFVVIGDELLTPSLESGCRAGVTRGAILEVARGVGLRPRQERLDPAMVSVADEVFLTSTRIECLPVATFDGRGIGGTSTRGMTSYPRARALRSALVTLIREETGSRASGGVA